MSRFTSIQRHQRLLMNAIRSWNFLRYRAPIHSKRIIAAGRQVVSTSAILPMSFHIPAVTLAHHKHHSCHHIKQSQADDVFPLYLDRLMDCIDPHALPSQAVLHQHQVAAGRWLLTRRIACNLTLVDIAECVAIDLSALQLLEAGVADPTLVSPAILRQLADIFADDPEDCAQVVRILYQAVGLGPAGPSL